MSSENPYRDQAERLRKKISKKQPVSQMKEEKEPLPPRSRVHRNQKTKKPIKVKYPIIRMLALFFILLPLIIFTVYTYMYTPAGSEKADTQTDFETVGVNKEQTPSNNIKEEEQIQEDKKNTEAVIEKEEEEKSTVKQPPEANAPKEQPEQPAQTENPASQPEEKETEPEGKIVFHTVKSNENLFRVSLKYYQSQDGIEKIKRANNLSNNEIRVGQVLKIPLD